MRAIELADVGKRYRIGSAPESYATLRGALTGLVRRTRRADATGTDLWALRGVSLTVDEGEVIGVVGSNGAGKSTLLKILSRITQPTTGISRTRGRVGALLEVGTGFHPELTGRENIFLNGAVLGMRKRDVERRFDEIVDFSGVEKFVDTPLKRYSSGMRLRLAFAVAAHLEPEIIVVDEVLAVGDVEFQRKCLGKMSELTDTGRTVVFVSHDHGAMARLCKRAIWLDHGEIRADGGVTEVLQDYLEANLRSHYRSDDLGDLGRGPVKLLSVEVSGGRDDSPEVPRRGEPLTVRVRLKVHDRIPGLDIAIYFKYRGGVTVIDEAWSDMGAPVLPTGQTGEHEVALTIPPGLTAGEYVVYIWVGTAYETLIDHEVMRFELGPRPEDRAEAVARNRLLQPEVTWHLRSGLEQVPSTAAEQKP